MISLSYSSLDFSPLYRYGYAVRNEFQLHNSIVKFDFEDPSKTTEYELRNGEFGTEPVFVGNGKSIFLTFNFKNKTMAKKSNCTYLNNTSEIG